jgi:hypothetical protein
MVAQNQCINPIGTHESSRILGSTKIRDDLSILPNTQQSGNIWVRYSTSSEVVRKKYHLALLQIFDLQGGQCSALHLIFQVSF